MHSVTGWLENHDIRVEGKWKKSVERQMFSRNLSGGSMKIKRNLSQDIRTPDKNPKPQTSECKSAASLLESE
jgi:hypothetical protein